MEKKKKNKKNGTNNQRTTVCKSIKLKRNKWYYYDNNINYAFDFLE